MKKKEEKIGRKESEQKIFYIGKMDDLLPNEFIEA